MVNQLSGPDCLYNNEVNVLSLPPTMVKSKIDAEKRKEAKALKKYRLAKKAKNKRSKAAMKTKIRKEMRLKEAKRLHEEMLLKQSMELEKQSAENDLPSNKRKRTRQITQNIVDLSEEEVVPSQKCRRLYNEARRQGDILSFLESLSNNVPKKIAHPEAWAFRKSYATTKNELSRKLFRLFNESVFGNKLPAGIPIAWNTRMTRSAGTTLNGTATCANHRKRRWSLIELSTKININAERMRDTLIHEMCHAAAWIINGFKYNKHGEVWRSWTEKAVQVFPELPPIEVSHAYGDDYIYDCVRCSHRWVRSKRSIDINTTTCNFCDGGKIELHIITEAEYAAAEQRRKSAVKKPPKFALYVKENFKAMQDENPSVPPKEIMKLLGDKFKMEKAAGLNGGDI